MIVEPRAIAYFSNECDTSVQMCWRLTAYKYVSHRKAIAMQ